MLGCHFIPVQGFEPAELIAQLQPAIYVTSLAAVELLRARDGGQQIIDSVDVTCGLSLGEYTALAFAGAFRYLIWLTVVPKCTCLHT